MSKLFKLVQKAIHEYGLIEEGDRILLAVSGGKDSTFMAAALSASKPALRRGFEMKALHISTDFCSCCKKSRLAGLLEGWGIPFDDRYVPVIGRLKEGRSMNCYWCSTQRRAELIDYATKGGFNKIALGHHLDDILETFFMNMSLKGELSSMPVRLSYSKWPVTLIRPLALVEEKQIVTWAEEEGIASAMCTCPYGQESKRKALRKRIEAFTGGSSAVKRRIFASLSNVKRDYLMGIVGGADSSPGVV
jgi:tRNA 2-thiocytidine biosynthesis protein TtcA